MGHAASCKGRTHYYMHVNSNMFIMLRALWRAYSSAIPPEDPTELKEWVLEKIAAESSSADALAASTDRAVIEKMRSALMRCDGAMGVGNVVTQRSASGRMPCWEQDLLLKRFWSQDQVQAAKGNEWLVKVSHACVNNDHYLCIYL